MDVGDDDLSVSCGSDGLRATVEPVVAVVTDG